MCERSLRIGLYSKTTNFQITKHNMWARHMVIHVACFLLYVSLWALGRASNKTFMGGTPLLFSAEGVLIAGRERGRARSVKISREILEREGSKVQMNICTDYPSLLARVRHFPLFSGMAETEILDVLKRTYANVREYPADCCITVTHPAIWLVLSGRVKVYGFGLRSDDRHLIRTAEAGSEVGLSALFHQKNHAEIELIVPEDCRLLEFDLAALRSLWDSGRSVVFTRNLASRLAALSCELIQKVAVLSCYEIADRVKLHDRLHGSSSSLMNSPPRVVDLAEEIGVNRTALYRILAKGK